MPSVVNLNGYGARVATDFLESGRLTEPHYKFRARMRGEVFDQRPRISYVFGSDEQPIPLSLSVFHQQRVIVVEVDVATLTSVTAEYPKLCKPKKEFAIELLGRLRAQYDGRWVRLARMIRRQRESLFIEGPFIPYEQGIALVSLAVRVGRDSNFDRAYEKAKKFLELHPENEEFERFQKVWEKPEAAPPKKHDGYQWTQVELRAIEQMAPLQPTSETFGFNRTEEERIRFNEIVWRQCQQRLEKMKVKESKGQVGASTESHGVLKDFFGRR